MIDKVFEKVRGLIDRAIKRIDAFIDEKEYIRLLVIGLIVLLINLSFLNLFRWAAEEYHDSYTISEGVK